MTRRSTKPARPRAARLTNTAHHLRTAEEKQLAVTLYRNQIQLDEQIRYLSN